MMQKVSRKQKRRSVSKAAKPPSQGQKLPSLVASEEECRDLKWSTQQEWLIANGMGSYASSSIIGMNTRRYHGLLVAATRHPHGRALLLSKFEETLVTPEGRSELSANRHHDVIHPEGYNHLTEFRLDPWPTFVYQANGVTLEKKILLVPGENTLVVHYRVRKAPGALELVVRPLVAARPLNELLRENPTYRTRCEQKKGCVILHPYWRLPHLFLYHNAELFEPKAYWVKNFEYAAEVSEHPQNEDLYCPGTFSFLLRPGEVGQLIATTAPIPPTRRARLESISARARKRLLHVPTKVPVGPLTRRLTSAAGDFLTKTESGAYRFLSGYHAPSVGGRDALIALPGFLLATHRVEVARSILEQMASHCRDGLLPVRFSEEDGAPEYDSVDTSLWFFWAVHHYLKLTRDARFVRRRLLETLRDILDYYAQGTQYHIIMDENGLITTSGETLPLTWMDARSGGLPLAHRPGRAVEVNALWYNALMTMAQLETSPKLKSQCVRLSRLVKRNFTRLFWNSQGHGLYDVVDQQPDESVRPNQLFAVGLPYPLLTGQKAKAVMEGVTRRLLTPVGLRSLSPGHSAYVGRLKGERHPKTALHFRGAAHPWLLGVYWDAYFAAYRRTKKSRAVFRQFLGPFYPRLKEAAWGTLPEAFEGDSPHKPHGAVASTRSVTEILRLIYEAESTDL